MTKQYHFFYLNRNKKKPKTMLNGFVCTNKENETHFSNNKITSKRKEQKQKKSKFILNKKFRINTTEPILNINRYDIRSVFNT